MRKQWAWNVPIHIFSTIAPPAVAEQCGQPEAHFFGGFLGERRHKQPLRVDAFGKQPGDPPGQNRGFARPRAGQHQRRAVVMPEGLDLLRVQPGFQLGNEDLGTVRVQVFGNRVQCGLHR